MGLALRNLTSLKIEAWTPSVVVADNPPVFTSNPVTSVIVGNLYSYTPAATDADGDVVVFTVPVIPSWMGISGGVLSGDSTGVAPGNYSVQVDSTANGVTVSQNFTVVVSAVLVGYIPPVGRVIAIDSKKIKGSFEQDPNARSKYWLAFGDLLGDDRLQSAVVTVDGMAVEGLFVIPADAADDEGTVHPANTIVSFFILGGEERKQYKVITRITTLDGSIDDRTFKVQVVEK